MADEYQKPFLDKVSDGLTAIGDKVSGSVDNYMKKREENQGLLDTMSPEDITNTMYGDGSALGKMKNSQDIQSLLNSQQPTPLTGYGNPSGSLPAQVAASAGTGALTDLTVNTLAGAQGTPLSPDQITDLNPISNVPVMGTQDQGTGSTFIAPPTQAAPQPQQSAQQITQGIVNPMAGSQGLAISGIDDAQKAGLLKAEAENKYYTRKAEVEQESLNKQQALEDKFNLDYQAKMDDYTDAIKDFKELAGQKVVPGAFLARQDTSAALSTGIAVAMGAMAGALNGTNQNIGLEMINKAIDKDVEAQKFNLDQAYRIKKSSIDDQSNLLSKMRERFGDEKSAILATKLAMTSLVQDKMNQELTQKGGASNLAVQSQAKLAKSQIVAQKEKLEYELKAAQAQEFQKQQMLMGKDKNNLSPEEAMVLYGDKAAQQYVSGFGLARSTEDKKKFQEEYGDSKNSLDAMKTIMTTDVNKLSPYDRARLGSELSLLTGKMRLAVLGPGAMTVEEYNRLRDALGDPTKIVALPGVEMEKLKTVANRLQSNQDNLVSLYFGKDKFNELKSNSVSNLVKPVK